MRSRRSIIRRIVALGGVVLTLMGSAQQTHALCLLTGCSQQSAGEHEEHADECCNVAVSVGCEEESSCSSARAPADACGLYHESQHCGVQNQSEECPDPAGCWCCKAPAPQQSPSPVEADSVAEVLMTCDIAGSALAELEFAPSEAMFASGSGSPPTDSDFCVRLCRFLI